MQDFTDEVQHLLLFLLLALLAVGLSAGYWAVIGQDSILLREDNPRLVEDELRIRRGTIYSADEQIIAQTSIQNNRAIREYPIPSMYSVVGYYSQRYGTGSVEFAYDAPLRGKTDNLTWETYWQQTILNQPQIGNDIRLTIHAGLQSQLQTLIGNQQGGAILIRVSDGAVLSLISQPTFNPNVLDAQWDNLRKDEGNPFFNRVLQGRYQPGGILQTPLMAIALLTRQSIDTPLDNAAQSVELNDLTLQCLSEPAAIDLTYTESFAYSCPKPFADLIQQTNPSILQDAEIDFFQNNQSLTNLLPEEINTNPNPPTSGTPQQLLDNWLGQGTLQVSPLQMVRITAAIVNQGDAPHLHIVSHIEADGEWQALRRSSQTTAMMTDATANRLRNILIQNTARGVTSGLQQSDYMIGGHIALAYSGDRVHTWLIAFIDQPDSESYAFAMLLEDSDNLSEAAHIGRTILISTQEQLNLPTIP